MRWRCPHRQKGSNNRRDLREVTSTNECVKNFFKKPLLWNRPPRLFSDLSRDRAGPCCRAAVSNHRTWAKVKEDEDRELDMGHHNGPQHVLSFK